MVDRCTRIAPTAALAVGNASVVALATGYRDDRRPRLPVGRALHLFHLGAA